MPSSSVTNDIGTSDGLNKTSLMSSDASSPPGCKFTAKDRTNTTPDLEHPKDRWNTIISTACQFPGEVFEIVMLNLVRNPNVTSSQLFRADIFYDSEKHPEQGRQGRDIARTFSHLKPEFKPASYELPGWNHDRSIVRQLIPRNSQLDRPLAQTCVFLSKDAEYGPEEHIVVYIPHVSKAEEMPFYHPAVEKLAFYHKSPSRPSPLGSGNDPGSISVSYQHFVGSGDDPRLNRTALKLLQTVHKHGQGELQGYEKRVHHDRIIPQKRYQDTYARLKAKYGRDLSENWVEVTDPGKHVFEDLGIAAFCLELWADMYAKHTFAEDVMTDDAVAGSESFEEVANLSSGESLAVQLPSLIPNDKSGFTPEGDSKPPFPGFVDIGCGNGLLVYILASEGYHGSGFDARERKTWSTFPPKIRQHLRQQLLVPSLLRSGLDESTSNANHDEWHNGRFESGTFIISNHADELTAWTPLLAYLNNSAFIAIPCCSHDLAGARYRAPEITKAQKMKNQSTEGRVQDGVRHEHPARLPQQRPEVGNHKTDTDPSPDADTTTSTNPTPLDLSLNQAAETGSLKRTLVQKKMASAYSTLCSYLGSLTETVGFEAETEILRIPSTRNHSVIGRRRRQSEDESWETRERMVRDLIEQELGRSIEEVGREWVERAEKLSRKPGSGH